MATHLSNLYLGTPPQHRLSKHISLASVVDGPLLHLLEMIHASPAFPRLSNIGLWALNLSTDRSIRPFRKLCRAMLAKGIRYDLLDRYDVSLDALEAKEAAKVIKSRAEASTEEILADLDLNPEL